MKTTITAIFLVITISLFPQNPKMVSSQHKRILPKDSIAFKEYVGRIHQIELEYKAEKRKEQFNLQQSIQEKDQVIVFQVIAGSITLVALLVIFILYQKKNRAYKLLVYQSLENFKKGQFLNIDDNPDTEITNEGRNSNPPLTDELKNQIEISLTKQLELKVFIESDLTLRMLAVKCCTNRSYLSQYIHERYKMNFNTFINMLRINEAKQILLCDNNVLPLKELYIRLGFNTYSVFNDAFKKHVGVTPAFYLKTVKNLLETTSLN